MKSPNYKHITIVNDDSTFIILMTLDSRMMPPVVASPMIIILMTLEVSFVPLDNIYITGINIDDRNTFIVQATACKNYHTLVSTYAGSAKANNRYPKLV